MPAKPKIRIENLSKVYGRGSTATLDLLQRGIKRSELYRVTGELLAVAGVSLTVACGEVLALIGASGSGKSTLIRLINQLITPTCGHVYIDEVDISVADDEQLRHFRLTKISMVFQQFGLFPHKTVAENVEYGLKLQGHTPDQRRTKALELLESMRLSKWAHHKPAALSGGMKQRVGLARALATDAEILLMDEPFSALDPPTRREMQDQLLELRARLDRTVVFVTHDMNEAVKLGDRIAVLSEGALIQVASPNDLLAQPANDHVRDLIRDAGPAQVLRALPMHRSVATVKIDRGLDGDALQALRTQNVDRIFVLGPAGEPVGFLVRELLDGLDRLSSEDAARLMSPHFRIVEANSGLSDASRSPSNGDVVALVDEAGRFQGVVTPAAWSANVE